MPKNDAEHKEKMRLGRLRALKEGKYDREYKRKSTDQKGVPHGNDALIAVAHRAKGESHPSAKAHRFIDPTGVPRSMQNIEHFLRGHPGLFAAEDVVDRRKPNGKIYTRAGNGLRAVSNGGKAQWKGWVKSHKDSNQHASA